MGGLKVVIKEQLRAVGKHVRDAIIMNFTGYQEAASLALSYLETSSGFVHTVSNFIRDTYHDLEVVGFPKHITWQLVSKLVYQVFAGDLDKVRGFMRVGYGACNPSTLVARSLWAIFKSIKVMKLFQLNSIANHPSIVGSYMTFLVTNLGMGQAYKLAEEVETLKNKVKTLSSELKAAKSTASSATTKANKALCKVAKQK
eukprot:8730491-Ditylum_brightwellii.AAC.1